MVTAAALATLALCGPALAGAGTASATTLSAAYAQHSAAGGTWGKPIEVPGMATINTGGNAYLDAVSCPSAGNCAAAGQYSDTAKHGQALVLSEVNGTWGTARELPGTGALNTGGDAYVNSLACASAGNCSAGGFYTDSSAHQQVFVASEVNGAWRPAIEVPGTSTLNKGAAQILALSCGSAGNCVAGGDYTDGSGRQQAFVVSQVNGAWGTASELAGTAKLNTNNAQVTSVSCPAPGNCTAGGY
ncbi:MAG TPA: hypothetical protein VF834_02615, partial [Streptosporangiaceae bacterium]